MKAALFFQLYGEDCRATVKEYQKNPAHFQSKQRLVFDAMRNSPPTYWVAEITHETGGGKGLSREFISGRKDYTYSNSKGSRGVQIEYLLESGKVYEVKKPVSWQNSKRFFCVVSDSGDIITVTREEVEKCLKNI